MSETLQSVGIDLGTSTTQLIHSRLTLENTAPAFTVPRMEISKREILYRSPIHFTPLLNADTLDAAAIGDLIAGEYDRAGIRPEEIQTGAVIITGETARKENARAVLAAISHLAGTFVVATAGPALESVLAARGAGADVYAREHGKWVLHLDIGGGTTNLARIDPRGKIVETGCLNVGGRLVKLDPQGTVTYVSPVLKGFPAPRVGERATPETLSPLLDRLVAVLEEAVGLSPPTALLLGQITDKTVKTDPMPEVLSFSGGVAALLEQEEPWLAYGDLGVLLAAKIRASKLMALPHILGRETIRATVVGAGSHATELSGSTVYYRSVAFPLQDLPVAAWTEQALREPAAVALPGRVVTGYDSLIRLAEGLTRAASTLPPGAPLAVVLEQDVAKALGQALATLLPPERPILCLDSLSLPPESFLDVAAPVGGGTALPVVIKTLAFS